MSPVDNVSKTILLKFNCYQDYTFFFKLRQISVLFLDHLKNWEIHLAEVFFSSMLETSLLHVVKKNNKDSIVGYLQMFEFSRN